MTKNQAAVLEAIARYGPLPDCALTPIVQHVSLLKISSSGIRSRRHELAVAGLVERVDSVKMPSGRSAAVWAVKA